MIKALVKIDPLKNRIARAVANAPAAKAVAASIWGAKFIELMDKRAPRDTNRYVNGWLQAGRGAGVSSLPDHPLRPTQSQYLFRLEQQYFREVKRLALLELDLRIWYEQKTGRKKRGYYNKLKRAVEKARERVARSEEEIKKASGDANVIVIGGRKSRAKNPVGKLSGLATVRLNQYGGEGSLKMVGTTAILTLHNKEPHCKLVERRFRSVGSAKSKAAFEAKAQMKAKYLLASGVNK